MLLPPYFPLSPKAPRLGPAYSLRPRPRRPAPPRRLKRLGLRLLQSRARGVGRCGGAEATAVASSTPDSPASSAAGASSRSSPGASSSSSRRCWRSLAEPTMALSMPLNGLKEEDKEPLIELFVKVSARLAVPPGRAPGALLAAGRGVPRRPRSAPAPVPLRAPASPPIVWGPPAPSRLRGPVEGSGVGTRAAATASNRAGSGGRRTSVPRRGGSGRARGRDLPALGPQHRGRAGPVTTPARARGPGPTRSPALGSAAARSPTCSRPPDELSNELL